MLALIDLSADQSRDRISLTLTFKHSLSSASSASFHEEDLLYTIIRPRHDLRSRCRAAASPTSRRYRCSIGIELQELQDSGIELHCCFCIISSNTIEHLSLVGLKGVEIGMYVTSSVLSITTCNCYASSVS